MLRLVQQTIDGKRQLRVWLIWEDNTTLWKILILDHTIIQQINVDEVKEKRCLLCSDMLYICWKDDPIVFRTITPNQGTTSIYIERTPDNIANILQVLTEWRDLAIAF